MRAGVTVGKIAGVPITVGWSWWVILPMVAFGMFVTTRTATDPAAISAVVSVLGSVLLLASVVVHELGHAVVAVRRRVEVTRVAVSLLGGYSEMSFDESRPQDQALIVLSGPLVSGVLALAFAVAAWLSPAAGGLADMFWLVALVNGGVAVFNALPAFPLDGGRFLRAVLVWRGSAPDRAEWVAVRMGLAVGGATVVTGVAMSIGGAPAAMVVVPAGLLVVVMTTGAVRSTRVKTGIVPHHHADKS